MLSQRQRKKEYSEILDRIVNTMGKEFLIDKVGEDEIINKLGEDRILSAISPKKIKEWLKKHNI